MGRVAIAAYKPKDGMAGQLLELVQGHVERLRAEGLATSRAPYILRAADGTIVEVFEWVSEEAIAQAHTNPAVQAMWSEFGEACDFQPLASLAECQGMFAGFAPVEE